MSVVGASILILEDEPLIAFDLEQAFIAARSAPIVVSSVATAMRALDTKHIQICVLDLWLKGSYAQEIIERLDRSGIPYVIYSAWPAPHHSKALEYIPKPVEADEVVLIIGRHLQQNADAVASPGSACLHREVGIAAVQQADIEIL